MPDETKAPRVIPVCLSPVPYEEVLEMPGTSQRAFFWRSLHSARPQAGDILHIEESNPYSRSGYPTGRSCIRRIDRIDGDFVAMSMLSPAECDAVRAQLGTPALA